MPSILSDSDKEIVKRMIPKASNKIQAVAVAKLYIAYPNRARWQYTGLQGAIVLANDLVGNTYWLKLVDISAAGKGVIWDQEIYDQWNYNQDRTFFHTFETEDYLAGLSFADEKEAKTFMKKMVDREKNASKATRNTAFGGARGGSAVGGQSIPTASSSGHGILGGKLGGFFGSHRHSSAPTVVNTPPEAARSSAPQYQNNFPQGNGLSTAPPAAPPTNGFSQYASLDAIDPNWKATWGDDLKAMGITDDMIRENQDFIADYIRQQQSQASAVSTPSAPPASRIESASRGTPPPPPPSRRSGAPSDLSVREPSPARGPPPTRFAAPPPIANAGKLAHTVKEPISSRARAQSAATSLTNPGPPPPPRLPKEEFESGDAGSRFGVPPPFSSSRLSNPPPTPARGFVPPPPSRANAGPPAPPSRDTSHMIPPPPSSGPPPPLPPKTPNAPALPPPTGRAVPPPPPRGNVPPPLSMSASSNPPPPPPMPSIGGPPRPPPMPSTGGPPPPPPMPSTGGPPPPPPMPTAGGLPPPPPLAPSSGPAPTLPHATGDRANLLGAIQGAGGIKALKKVDRSQVRDRSAAAVPGSESSVPTGSISSAGPSAAGGGGLADALAMALSKRKQKVSASDDEDDDDEW